MKEMAALKDREVARPLKVLVPLINEALDHAHEAGIEYRRKAGELFQEARINFRTTPEWYSWIGRTFKHRETGKPFSETTVKRYVQLAEVTKEFRVARAPQPFRIISEFSDPNRDSHHRPEWHEPIREALNTVNVERLAQEKQSKEKETRLMRQLAHELIDIGYKVLASKLHPDKGGSAEAMTRLNRVRSILKNAL